MRLVDAIKDYPVVAKIIRRAVDADGKPNRELGRAIARKFVRKQERKNGR